MPVDASLLTRGNPTSEIKYNEIPNIADIANKYAQGDQTRATTAGQNILNRSNQLAYDNTQGAQNVLAQNPNLRGQELIAATAPYGEQGAKLAQSQIGTQAANTGLTLDNLKVAYEMIQPTSDQPSWDRFRDAMIQNVGPQSVAHLPTVFNPETANSFKMSLKDIWEATSRAAQVERSIAKDQKDAEFKGAMINLADRKVTADTNYKNVRLNQTDPETVANIRGDAQNLTDTIKSIEGFATNLQQHSQFEQDARGAIADLKKLPGDGKPITGGLATQRLAIANTMGSLLGLSPEQKNEITTTQNLNSTLKKLVSQAAANSPLKDAKGISNADLAVIAMAGSGDLDYTEEQLIKLLNAGINNGIAAENKQIRNARFAQGKRQSPSLNMIASRPLRAILSTDGVTVTTPDGKHIQAPDPTTAQKIWEEINQIEINKSSQYRGE